MSCSRLLAGTVAALAITILLPGVPASSEDAPENQEIRLTDDGRLKRDPVYHPDGMCEVTVAVTVRQVIEELKRIVRRHYVGNRWHDHTFDRIVVHTQDRVLTATG